MCGIERINFYSLAQGKIMPIKLHIKKPISMRQALYVIGKNVADVHEKGPGAGRLQAEIKKARLT